MDLHVLWTILQLGKLEIFLISPQLGINMKGRKKGREDIFNSKATHVTESRSQPLSGRWKRILREPLMYCTASASAARDPCASYHLWHPSVRKRLSAARTENELPPWSPALQKLRKPPSFWLSIFRGSERCLNEGDENGWGWCCVKCVVSLKNNPLKNKNKKNADVHYQDILLKEQRFLPF